MPPLLYDDTDVSADPRKKDNKNHLLEKYDNNEVYVCLKNDKIKLLINKIKIDKIKQLVNKRSTTKIGFNNDTDDENDDTD
jgi:hypothetical protein